MGNDGLRMPKPVIALLTLSSLLLCAAAASKSDRPVAAAKPRPPVKVTDLRVPEECGRKAKILDHVAVHLVGSIDKSSLNGKRGLEFTNSSGGVPLSFQVANTTYVPEGLDHGIIGMCAGQKVRVVVPPEL